MAHKGPRGSWKGESVGGEMGGRECRHEGCATSYGWRAAAHTTFIATPPRKMHLTASTIPLYYLPHSPRLLTPLSSVLTGTPRIPRAVNQTLGAIRAAITRRYLEDRQLIISCIYNSPKCLLFPCSSLPPTPTWITGHMRT